MRRVGDAKPRCRVLARYTGWDKRSREVVVRNASAGSTLVIDRDAATGRDRRLLAHLPADEPLANAALVCRDYLDRTAGRGCRCRAVVDEDVRVAPLTEDLGSEAAEEAQPVDGSGFAYRLERVESRMSIPELRWCRRGAGTPTATEVVSLREAIGRIESYEPLRAATLRSLACARTDDGVSTTTLRAELARVQESPIILNRALRDAVLATVERQELSMSEIAIRCGRIKRDGKGRESGETSWLARRLGLLPEGGQSAPTPWIHSDVLGLIARSGLGISPREVELG